MARYAGVSQCQVRQVWQAADVKPHRLKTFKLSHDPQLAEKVIDVVGLYLNPPDNALVLSVDEKTQIQALDRTHPMLPLRPGQVDNSSTHTTEAIRDFLAAHPRFHLHFTPTSASWLNAVETPRRQTLPMDQVSSNEAPPHTLHRPSLVDGSAPRPCASATLGSTRCWPPCCVSTCCPEASATGSCAKRWRRCAV